MGLISKFIDEPIDRYFAKYRHAYDRERTQMEIDNYWKAAVRNISPVSMKEHKSGKYIVINNKTLARTIIGGVPTETENGYPKGMDDSMITGLIGLSSKGSRIAYSLKLNPIDTGKAKKDIQSAMYITQVNADEKQEKVQQKKHIDLQDMDTKIAQEHNESNYKDVTENIHKVIDSSFIITIWANTEAELYAIESDITLVLESTGVKYELPDYNHLETYLAAQPFNSNLEKSQVRILSPYAAMIASTRNPNSITDEKGLWCGVDKDTNKNIIIDIDKLVAPHLLCVGPTGSGKTAAIFAYLMRLMGQNYRVIYITPKEDPGTNHRALLDYYGEDIVSLIDIGPRGAVINPLQIIYDQEILHDDIEEYTYAYNMHKEIVIRFMQAWFEDTGSVNMTGLLDSILNQIYKDAGIFRDVPSTWHNATWPVMADLIEALEERKRTGHLDVDERKTVNAILNKSIPFGRDGILGYMNNPTTVDFSKKMLIFDMSKIPPLIKQSMNLLVTAICSQRFRADNTYPTILAVDEARIFLQNEELTEFLLQSITLGRSARVSLWCLTQQITDLTKADVSEEFSTNTKIKLVLAENMLDENVEIVQDHFNLTDADVEHLLTSSVGDGILLVGNQHIPIHVQLTQKELDIINDKFSTESPEEKMMAEPKIIPEFRDLVFKHGFCLDEWATDFDLPGWKRERVQKAVAGTGLVTAWIREDMINERGHILNQSIDHYSTVIQIGAYILQKGVVNMEINHHTDADVVFTTSNNTDAKFEHAIEFEIDGSHTEDQLKHKRNRLINEYGNAYFVCHSRFENKLVSKIGPNYVFPRGTKLKNLLDGIIG